MLIKFLPHFIFTIISICGSNICKDYSSKMLAGTILHLYMNSLHGLKWNCLFGTQIRISLLFKHFMMAGGRLDLQNKCTEGGL